MKVPPQIQGFGSPYGQSPLSSEVSPTNLLMAAAQMQEQGKFSTPEPKDPHPSTKQHRVRKLKVVR